MDSKSFEGEEAMDSKSERWEDMPIWNAGSKWDGSMDLKGGRWKGSLLHDWRSGFVDVHDVVAVVGSMAVE